MNSALVASLVSLLVLSACSAPSEGPAPVPPMPEDLLSSRAARETGGDLFERHCALCHGVRGDGHGARRTLSKPPADLTDPLWRRRAEPEAVFRAIRDGVPRSPMAAWPGFSDEDVWALVAHVLSLSEGPA